MHPIWRNSALPRWLEWGVLFMLMPALLLLQPVARFAVLALATLYALYIVLVEKPGFKAAARSEPQYLAIRIPIFAGLIFLFSRLVYPETFLNLPKLDPTQWLMIMLFYPVVSALPQEFLYRRFYFWRYAALFPNATTMAIGNVLLFAFVHLVYGNAVAIFLSLLGGMIFTVSYQRSGRLLPVWIEHSIYGMAIFTSGLGHFFYIPFN